MTYTLITGASKGIGRALAIEYSAHNHNLVLTGRNQTELETLKASILTSNPTLQVETFSIDLNDKQSYLDIKEFCESKNIVIDNLVNNAGFGSFGEFSKLDINKQLEMINVNITSLVSLTYIFMPDIIRTKGRIMLIGSTAAFQAIPFLAIYAATKAFVKSFSLAVNQEIQGSGATLTVVNPGATNSNFFNASGRLNENSMKMTSCKDLARFAHKATYNRKPIVTYGFINNMRAQMGRLISGNVAALIAKKIINYDPKR